MLNEELTSWIQVGDDAEDPVGSATTVHALAWK